MVVNFVRSIYLSIVGELFPPERYRIILALVKAFGHVSHITRAIISSFLNFLFLHWTSDVIFLLSFQSFCSHAEGTMKFRSWPFAWVLVFYYLSYGPHILFSKVSLTSQSGSFALQAVMGYSGIALIPRSTLTHGLQWTPAPSPEEEPPSGQSHNLFK